MTAASRARAPPARQRRPHLFSFTALRRREIERHAKHVGGDLRRHLIAWCWHNGDNRRDPGFALVEAAARMGCQLDEDRAEAVLAKAADMRQHRGADTLAKFLGVTYEQRAQLGIVTIGAIDKPKRERSRMEKERQREREQRRRTQRGAKPRAEYETNSLARTKPWEKVGESRATWFRKRRERETFEAMRKAPPLGDRH